MNKAKELKTVTGLVKAILQENKQARNSDSFLYFKVLKKLGSEKEVDIDNIPITLFLLKMTEWGFPPFESVRRARQKIQADFPELSGNREVQEHREANESAFRQYARS